MVKRNGTDDIPLQFLLKLSGGADFVLYFSDNNWKSARTYRSHFCARAAEITVGKSVVDLDEMFAYGMQAIEVTVTDIVATTCLDELVWVSRAIWYVA